MFGRPASPGAEPQRVVGNVVDRVAASEREALADRHLARLQLEPEHRGERGGQRAPGEQRLLELAVGALEALARRARSRSSRRTRGSGTCAARRRPAPRRSPACAARRAGAGRSQGRRGARAPAPPPRRRAVAERPHLRVDELVGAGPVAVQGGPGTLGLGQLEGQLGALGELARELQRRTPRRRRAGSGGGGSCAWSAVRRGRPALLPGAAGVAESARCAVAGVRSRRDAGRRRRSDARRSPRSAARGSRRSAR